MTVIKEYRIPMPFSLEEFQIGQLYATAKASKDNTGGGEGVEVLANEPFSEGERQGQFTHKIIRLGSRLPAILQSVLPARLNPAFDEKSWNSFPHCKTIITQPGYFKECFEVTVLTINKEDLGETENIHNLSKKELEQREVIRVDIANDQIGRRDYESMHDPAKYSNVKDKFRSELGEFWLKNLKSSVDRHSRETEMSKNSSLSLLPCSKPKYMCSYKLISVKFKWYGLQKLIENFMQGQQERVVRLFHRMLYCWQHIWMDMSIEDVRVAEKEMDEEMNANLYKGEKIGLGMNNISSTRVSQRGSTSKSELNSIINLNI